jgi:cation transport regulator ChaC
VSDALWYFGYGSNLNPAIFLERRRMQPLTARWGWLDGYRLCFNLPIGPGERGVANLEAVAGERTCGVLYQLTAHDSDRLDRTEGVPQRLYRRVAVSVRTEDGAVVEAFTYQSSFASGGRKPSARYLGLLLDGARHHGLPAEWIAYLSSLELAVDEREGTATP